MSDWSAEGAKIPLVTLGEPGAVFAELALDMVAAVEANNAAGRPTVLILPVGPTGQYPYFVRLVARRGLSLKHCWFINMDEYLGADGEWLPVTHPLSFRGFMASAVYDRLPAALVMPPDQRVFPDPGDLGRIPRLIADLGGVDLCVAGLGLNGHLAFNEPRPDLSPEDCARLPTRTLELTECSRTVGAITSLAGDLDRMPTRCVTVGMAEILGAARIRVGCFRDWHGAAIRRAAYGTVSAAFSATLLQRHPDAVIYASANAVGDPPGGTPNRKK